MLTEKNRVTSYTTPNDRDLVTTRVFDAPRALVFDCWTNPEHLPKWFTGPDGMTMPECEMDLRPGGKWRYLYAGRGKQFAVGGKIVEVTSPTLLVMTESWGPDMGDVEAVSRIEFIEQGNQTTVIMTTTYPSNAVREAAIATGMNTGVDASFDRLDGILATLS